MIINLEKATTAQEALETAKLNWTVNVQPMNAQLANGTIVNVPGNNLVVREDNKVLGVVGSRYRSANNADIFKVADDVIAQIGGFYDRALVFKGDRQVVLQVKLPTTLTLGKDVVARYLTLTNSFDGSIALKGFVTPVRILCQNMVAMAMKRANDSITIRHSSQVQDRLNDVGRLLKLTADYHQRYDQLAGALYSAKFSFGQMNQLASELIPVKVNEDGEEFDSTRARNNRDQLVALFEGGRGHKESEIVGTAWAAYNAVAEYVDHVRSSRVGAGGDTTTKRLESAYFGSGLAMKTRSLDLIRSATGV